MINMFTRIRGTSIDGRSERYGVSFVSFAHARRGYNTLLVQVQVQVQVVLVKPLRAAAADGEKEMDGWSERTSHQRPHARDQGDYF